MRDDSVLQPSVEAAYQGLSLNIWGTMELTDEGRGDNAGEFTEIDYTVSFTHSFDTVNLTAGVIYYQFPNIDAHSTTELFASVECDMLLNPSITLYRDIDEGEGWYTNLTAGHTFEGIWQPGEDVSVSLDLGGGIGYGSSDHNAFNYGSDVSSLTDGLLTLSLPVAFGERLTLTPFLSFSSLLDGSIRDEMSDDDNLWVGIVLRFLL